ncbi:MAG: DcaP family trimeric outer membrane transporter [Lentisphaerota bacterium]
MTKIKCFCCLAVLVCFVMTNVASAVDPINVTSKFKVSLYGYVKLDASYDTHRTSAGDLMFYVLPEVAGEKDDEFNMTAKETRFGLDIAGPEMGSAKTTGKIETDFYGPGGSANSPNLRLRLAYADVAWQKGLFGYSFRAGQDWETFITVVPKILNFSYLADAGALGLRRPQFRGTLDFGENDTKMIVKVAAARTIGEDIDGGGQDDGVDSGRPTVQYNVVLQSKLWTSKPAKIGVSGHYGMETLDTSVSGKVTNVDSADYDTWSVIGSLILPVSEKVALQGTVWTGENLDTYFGGIGQGINKTLETAIAAKGGFGQLVVDLTDALNVNVGYGLDDPDDADLSKGNRAKNSMIFASVFYKLNAAATLGFEYSNITTSYAEGDDAKNNRFQGSAIYKF